MIRLTLPGVNLTAIAQIHAKKVNVLSLAAQNLRKQFLGSAHVWTFAVIEKTKSIATQKMQKNNELYSEYFKPYEKRLFNYLVIISFLIILVVNISIYAFASKNSLQQYQADLKKIATDIAGKIDAYTHEKITSPDQQKSAEYTALESHFQTIQLGNPNIDDIYTLRPSGKSHLMSFVVSGMPTFDSNNNGVIDQEEIKPAIGELYDTSDVPAMEEALSSATVDKKISFDKWGAWLSGYAPLRNNEGVSIGIVGVDYSADVIIQNRWQLIKIQLLSDACIIPFILVACYFISKRINRPLKKLGAAMEHVIHGELDYSMPYDGYIEDKMFADLFNNMKEKLGHRSKK